MKAKIIAMGSYTPKKIVTNTDLEKLVDTSDEWIVKRTGIKERRIAAENEAASDMGTSAINNLFESGVASKESIDYIIVATMTPDYLSPATAALIQSNLGLSHIPAIDIQAACTGFLYALSMAKAYVESGMYNNVLVVATEKMSCTVDFTDRGSCILFGDGAAAAVVSSEGEGFAIEDVLLGADGSESDLIVVPAGGSREPASQKSLDAKQHYVKLQGKEVFKHAVRRMAQSSQECLKRNNLPINELNWVVPHQANARIIEALVKQLKVADEKVYKTVHKYGNTSASSIPIALDELTQKEDIKEGESILLVAFGAGLTWGSALLSKT